MSIESKPCTVVRECSPKRTSSYHPMHVDLENMSRTHRSVQMYIKRRNDLSYHHDRKYGRSDRTERQGIVGLNQRWSGPHAQV